MLKKTFENNGKNISKNIVNLKLNKHIKPLLHFHLVYVCVEEKEF